jgi:TRAP-type C4-dicarboxylate transport system permease small subunit
VGIQVLRIVVGVQLTCLMLLTTADVVMRYAFGSPFRGTFEISELMVALVMFSGFPLASLNNQHVSIDLLDRFFSPAVDRVVEIFSSLLCFGIFGSMALLLLRKASQMTLASDVTVALNISILPFVYVMVGLILLAALIHGVKCILAFSQSADLNHPSNKLGGPAV